MNQVYFPYLKHNESTVFPLPEKTQTLLSLQDDEPRCNEHQFYFPYLRDNEPSHINFKIYVKS